MTIQVYGYDVEIDKNDYKRVCSKSWSILKNHGKDRQIYIRTNISVGNGKYKSEMLHRFIMNATKGQIIDHINGNTLDNRKCNLRFVDRYQNARNSKTGNRNKTGYKGVSWSEFHQKYRTYIFVNGKNIHLGLFDDPELAYKAYCNANRKYYGKYGRVK